MVVIAFYIFNIIIQAFDCIVCWLEIDLLGWFFFILINYSRTRGHQLSSRINRINTFSRIAWICIACKLTVNIYVPFPLGFSFQFFIAVEINKIQKTHRNRK